MSIFRLVQDCKNSCYLNLERRDGAKWVLIKRYQVSNGYGPIKSNIEKAEKALKDLQEIESYYSSKEEEPLPLDEMAFIPKLDS